MDVLLESLVLEYRELSELSVVLLSLVVVVLVKLLVLLPPLFPVESEGIAGAFPEPLTPGFSSGLSAGGCPSPLFGVSSGGVSGSEGLFSPSAGLSVPVPDSSLGGSFSPSSVGVSG